MLAAGCWQPRYFVPRENLNGTGPNGDAAAVYQIAHDERDARGEIRIWCEGAEARYTDAGAEVVDLHIGFEIENTGPSPLELDLETVAIEELYVDGYLREPLTPETREGDGRAAPGTTARVDLRFRPPTTYPRDIDSFSLRFAVRDEAGEMVGQVTPFSARPTGAALRGVGDPFWGPGVWANGVRPWGFYGGYGFWGGPWGGSGLRCR